VEEYSCYLKNSILEFDMSCNEKQISPKNEKYADIVAYKSVFIYFVQTTCPYSPDDRTPGTSRCMNDRM
jgi:hypothetical protein